MMMGFEVTVHPQCGGMRGYFPQQSFFQQQPQVVVDRGERDGGYAPFDHGVDLFGRVMSRSSHDGFENDLALMSGRQPMLPGKFPKLFVTQMHGGLDENDYQRI